MKKLILAVFVLFVTTGVFAQDAPQIPDEVLKLYDYEGTWEGNITMTMNGQTSTGTLTHIWSKIADGWGMLIDETADIPAMGHTYIGHNILGYDIGEGMYHMYTIDNFADMHDHKGTMKGNEMYLEQNGVTPDGKTTKEEITIQFINNNEYKASVNVSINGEPAYTLTMDAKKVK